MQNYLQFVKTKAHILSLLSWLILFTALSIFFKYQAQEQAIDKAKHHINEYLLSVSAHRQYVSKKQKEEVYRLQHLQVLDIDYFSPELLSSTYSAKEANKLFNELRNKLNLPPIKIRFASPNARNPENDASPGETRLLELMQEGSIKEYSEIRKTEYGKTLYYVLPTKKNSSRCMRCHSSPEIAPKDLVERYGDTRGFGEEIGQIRAILTTTYPINAELEEANALFFRLSSATFFALFIIYVISTWFILQLKDKEKILVRMNEELESTVQERTTELEEKNRELETLSVTDRLTGLYNRHKLDDVLENEFHRALRFSHSFGVILLDVDHFKNINDTHGHQVGDDVLVSLASLVLSHKRKADTIGRWGGEEFLFICPETDLEGTCDYAEILRKTIEDYTIPVQGKITASLGVAAFKKSDTIEQLIARADEALYRAKKSGRNRVESEPA